MNPLATVVYKCINFGCYFARKNYVFLGIDDVDKLIESSLVSIKKYGYKPEAVIAVLRGGYYPARKIADALSAQLGSIGISYYSFEILGINFAYFPWVVDIILRSGGMKKAKLQKPLDINVEGRKVLLVDDDMGYGKTLECAINEIKKGKPREIKVLILSPNNKEKLIDFFPSNLYDLSFDVQKKKGLYKDKLRFKWPWEQISPHYKDYQKLILAMQN